MIENEKTLKGTIAELIEEIELLRGAMTRLAETQEELLKILKRGRCE